MVSIELPHENSATSKTSYPKSAFKWIAIKINRPNKFVKYIFFLNLILELCVYTTKKRTTWIGIGRRCRIIFFSSSFNCEWNRVDRSARTIVFVHKISKIHKSWIELQSKYDSTIRIFTFSIGQKSRDRCQLVAHVRASKFLKIIILKLLKTVKAEVDFVQRIIKMQNVCDAKAWDFIDELNISQYFFFIIPWRI